MIPGNRFSPYNDYNHQAPLWIATSLALTYTVLFFIARMIIKSKLLSWDDLVLAIANVVGLVQWCLLYAALDAGVGKVVPEGSHILEGARLIYASRILTLITVGLAKCSIILFIRRIFLHTTNGYLRTCDIMLAVAGCWAVISPMIVSIGCHPSDALSMESQSGCPGDTARWWVVTGIDVFLELALFTLPIYLFHFVQLRRLLKIQLTVAFSLRLGVPALFIAYSNSYAYFRQHNNTSLGVIPSLTLQQALCGYGLISATTPSLKGFLARFFTDGAGAMNVHADYSASRSRSKLASAIAMQSLHQHKSSSSPLGGSLVLDPVTSTYEALAYAGPTGSDKSRASLHSYGSEQMIIQRNVEVSVTTGAADASGR